MSLPEFGGILRGDFKFLSGSKTRVYVLHGTSHFKVRRRDPTRNRRKPPARFLEPCNIELSCAAAVPSPNRLRECTHPTIRPPRRQLQRFVMRNLSEPVLRTGRMRPLSTGQFHAVTMNSVIGSFGNGNVGPDSQSRSASPTVSPVTTIWYPANPLLSIISSKSARSARNR